MEERSVLASGNSLSLSLPRDWCRANGVEKGSKLSIYTDRNSLYIRSTNNGTQELEQVEDTQPEETGVEQEKKKEEWSVRSLIEKRLKEFDR